MSAGCGVFTIIAVCLIAPQIGASSIQCKSSKCLRKCCPDRESYTNENRHSQCTPDTTPFILDELDVNDFSLLHGDQCENNEPRVKLDQSDATLTYQLLPNATLIWLDKSFTYRNFCMELYNSREVAIVCVNGDDDDDDAGEDQREMLYSFEDVPQPVVIQKMVDRTGMIISMPFLLATFIVYALLPDRNLHMKALMSYVINLFGGYALLVTIQLSKSKFSFTSCVVLGYCCLFFFMVSFFWMNVICVDIWFAFSGLRGFSGSKSAERRRFLIYCAYAWGMSILHVLGVFAIDKYSNEKSWYHPGIGNGQCFLQLGYPELLYFYGPMGIIITINIILFAITAIRIRSIRKDTSMLKKDDNKRHSYENDKQKFNLYLKLLFAMGVNWSMELISWAVNWNVGHLPAYVWYLTDFCNASYGVLIFFIFVFKRSIWKLLKKRYYSFIGKPYRGHSMTQTHTSRVTNCSTVTTSVHDVAPGGLNENTTLTTET